MHEEDGLRIVSSSSSSRTQSSLNVNRVGEEPEANDTIKANQGAGTISRSCDDLLQTPADRNATFQRSQSCQSLKSNQSQAKGKYDHVQSKIKQYIKVLNVPSPHCDIKSNPSPSTKEEYLVEINHRLARELEEKNALLLKLQENYEHLLLKYAEAQNKIDNLRLRTVNAIEPSHTRQSRVASFPMHLSSPAHQFKVAGVKDSERSPFRRKDINNECESRVDRPTTLAVDSGLRVVDKAVTPTDSEGVSSVITSMSGHSKILTNLEDGRNDGDAEKKPVLKSEVLESALPVNDPIDKVKNWQDSLPPLELIETPDNALYDVDVEPIVSPSTRYNEITELGNIPEGSEDWSASNTKTISQAIMKKYLRTLSLPSSLTRRNMLAQIYKRRNNHTIDLSSPLHVDCTIQGLVTTDVPSPMIADLPATNILHRRKKRPPFVRSLSLPVYEYESSRSGARNNIPPLDLDNLTFSEDETSPVSQSNLVTSPSFLTSHDCSFQTLNSLTSCKATVSDYSAGSNSRFVTPVINKSTSITPDRSKNMIFSEPDVEPDFEGGNCNICGESVGSVRSVSYQGMQSQEWLGGTKCSSVQRSVSFSSESNSPVRCLHERPVCEDGGVRTFETFSRDLKARSQVIMKALTAHVHNT